MTTIEFNDTALDTKVEVAPRRNWLSRWYVNWQRYRQNRITLSALAHMDEYMLRDIGIDPMDVHDALMGVNSSALFDPVRKRSE
jgi:uncharacterized protein YjiS (DUF1127 family)